MRLRRQYDLRLNHLGGELSVFVGDARLPDHRRAAFVQRGAFTYHFSARHQRTEKVGLGFDGRRAAVSFHVQNGRYRAERIRKRHHGAAMDDAWHRTDFIPRIQLRLDAVGRYINKSNTQQIGEKAFDAFLQCFGPYSYWSNS